MASRKSTDVETEAQRALLTYQGPLTPTGRARIWTQGFLTLNASIYIRYCLAACLWPHISFLSGICSRKHGKSTQSGSQVWSQILTVLERAKEERGAWNPGCVCMSLSKPLELETLPGPALFLGGWGGWALTASIPSGAQHLYKHHSAELSLIVLHLCYPTQQSLATCGSCDWVIIISLLQPGQGTCQLYSWQVRLLGLEPISSAPKVSPSPLQ